MKKLLVLAALLSAPVFPALGQSSMESMNLANALGTVLASEDMCDLTYDQDAIAGFIADKVSADDLDFAPMLHLMVQGQEYQLKDMSPSQKTAHCTQIARSARAYKFIQ